MKKIWLIIVPVVIIVAIVAGYFMFTNNSLAYVSIDINPSVEFVTDGMGKVLQVTASNDDGDLILLDQTESLIGLDVEDATEKVIELALEYGYLDPDALESDPNAVTISTEVVNDAFLLKDRLRTRVMNRVENYFKNNGIYGVVFGDVDMQDIISEAQALGIGVGRLKLIRTIQAIYLDFTTEEALTMTNQALIEMLRNSKGVIQDQIASFNTQIAELQSVIATQNGLLTDAQSNLSLAQTTLTDYEAIDTSAYTEAELTAYQDQLALYQTAVTDLEEQVAAISGNLQSAETELAGLQAKLTAYESHLLELRGLAQTKKQNAFNKYNNWLQHKAERGQQVKNRWSQFKQNLTTEQRTALLNYFKDAWKNQNIQ